MVADSQFYDHSTFTGKISLYLTRLNWKYVPGVVLMVALVAVGLYVSSTSDGVLQDSTAPVTDGSISSSTVGNNPNLLQLSLPSNPPQPHPSQPSGILRRSPLKPFVTNPWNPNKVSPPGVFESEGCENGLMSFENFGTIDKSSMKSLKLRDLIIDAQKLTRELEGWTNLESITIENAWISGEFSRVYLPKLTKFIYHQFHNAKTDTYKIQDKLKSILFFDKVQAKTWDLEKDILNLNVTIQVSIGGTKILQVEPEFGDIFINTHYCEDILKNLEGVFPVSTLSLNWCPVTNASIHKIPKDLKFLQFNNALPNNDDLAIVIKSLTKLKELHTFLRFHCEWPGYEIFLNVSELPETTETISVTNLDISFSPGVKSNVRNLSLGNYVTPSLVENFDTVFANLRSIALFNLSATDAYPLLQQVIKTPVEWILVTNLTRIAVDDPKATNPEKVVEWFLSNAGVPKGQPCFLVECVNGTYFGRSVTDFEKNFYRFTRLAFDKIDTYEDYMIWDAIPK